MSTKTLIAKIDSLPPEKRAEVESFVDRLAGSPPEKATASGAIPGELVVRIEARRQRLFKERGLFDSVPLIREFRETGR